MGCKELGRSAVSLRIVLLPEAISDQALVKAGSCSCLVGELPQLDFEDLAGDDFFPLFEQLLSGDSCDGEPVRFSRSISMISIDDGSQRDKVPAVILQSEFPGREETIVIRAPESICRDLAERLEESLSGSDGGGSPCGGLSIVQGEEEEEEEEEDESAMPVTIKVDLDGTIAEKCPDYDPTKIGPPRPGAREVLKRWKENGWRIIINTVRGNTSLVERYLDDHGIPYDYVNYNPDQPPDSSHKIYADIDVDDTAVDADRPWEEIDRLVQQKLVRQGRIAACLVQKAAEAYVSVVPGKFAPGIDRRGDLGDPFGYDKDEATFIIQRHLARKAGPHYDIRFGDRRGLYSWATRKEWLKSPGRIMLFQQPIHRWDYKDFEGWIEPPRYGAGEVRKIIETPMRIVERDERSIAFELPEYVPGIRYKLIRLNTKQPKRPMWLLAAKPMDVPAPAQVLVMGKGRSRKRPISAEEARKLAEQALADLGPYIQHGVVVGSIMRHPYMEQYGDVDLLVIPKEEIPADLINELASKGVDVFRADMASFEPSLLHWALGKRIIWLKRVAARHGMKLNRYGLWRKDEGGQWQLVTTDAGQIVDLLSKYDAHVGRLPDFVLRELERFRQLRKSSSIVFYCRHCGSITEDCSCKQAVFEPYWSRFNRCCRRGLRPSDVWQMGKKAAFSDPLLDQARRLLLLMDWVSDECARRVG